MSNEATVHSSLQIKTGNIDYRSNPTAFQTDVAGKYGPTPGVVLVPVLGTSINLGALATPGLAVLHNIDPTNYVDWGVYDTGTGTFYPIGRLMPADVFVHRFSPEMFGHYVGTSTSETGSVQLYMRANSAPAYVTIECFEA